MKEDLFMSVEEHVYVRWKYKDAQEMPKTDATSHDFKGESQRRWNTNIIIPNFIGLPHS